ncbi:hypothetical protein BU23DRAFT_258967 [Bimuria novae-zelandiae CBS 107.79]|uniref:Uncharacterized protein n=1 Tax=Bimuria novae-zelandiae CBS 107.79 TaxID=1447943 RepID=A0A6A5V619_9PLEO|nr:hypothetical protein BU23DRAFT_258967 [Bimuria novae-zelandiae CBS 107.79]
MNMSMDLNNVVMIGLANGGILSTNVYTHSYQRIDSNSMWIYQTCRLANAY